MERQVLSIARLILNRQIKVLLLLCLCFFISCSKKENADNGEKTLATSSNQQNSTAQKNQKEIVIIQPFEGASPRLVDYVYKRLEAIVPEVRINESIEIPQSFYLSETNRYRADSLIRFLWNKSTHSSVVLGITESGISRTTNGYQDFGIIGLAFRNGHSCVVSTQLFGGENVEERLFKSVLHELAHTQGLKHCERKPDCYMQGAKNGEYPIDEFTDFCPHCKAFLKEKGWKLK